MLHVRHLAEEMPHRQVRGSSLWPSKTALPPLNEQYSNIQFSCMAASSEVWLATVQVSNPDLALAADYVLKEAQKVAEVARSKSALTAKASGFTAAAAALPSSHCCGRPEYSQPWLQQC